MPTSLPRIYLASRSSRRRELLKQIGVPFEVLLFREHGLRGRDLDEAPNDDESPDGYVERVARDKAEAGWLRVTQRGLPRFPVLAADTTVCLQNRIFGKPADRNAAIDMLKELSGREHRVLTAVVLSTIDDTASDGSDYNGVNTTVVFNPGESTKTVPITMRNDGMNEGTESFSLQLSDASGGVLGEVTDASVTLFDDDDDPANDDFAQRTVLPAAGTRSGTTTGASSQSGEPNHGRFSVWYGWTSPAGNPISSASTSAPPETCVSTRAWTAPLTRGRSAARTC